MTTQDDWIANLKAASGDLARSSTVTRVADLLRQQITDGHLVPGAALPEKLLSEAANVSRNTMREAFRLLAQEGLVVHEFNRGVFVRSLTLADVADVYRVRRILEGAGVRNAAEAGPEPVARVGAVVAEGERAAAEGRWADVGTADIRFHQAVAALCGSPRVDDMMRHLLAELRLVFHVMGSAERFHGPYLPRNRRLADLLAAGDLTTADQELRAYLYDAEAQLTAAYTAVEPA
ncbi:GntR family transcriptional regulator [Actinomadura hibisca]|uniref:GntR family transcriptional regulator n=1 Tax=Actinomadura hibisca TaxID=68565 RepID=UPI00082EA037|nr:GntR family transcriptional regulator [Actinomadura hibisca]